MYRIGILLVVGVMLAAVGVSVDATNPSTVRRETISGVAVAYTNGRCSNSYAPWALVVHTPNRNDDRVEYIQVNFSYPCGRAPNWVSRGPGEQKFRVTRNKRCDRVLEQYFEAESSGTKKQVPIWHAVRGEEKETLPFGQVLPCYDSLDYPVKPVI